jgi:uncharacterized membrane protein
VHSIGKRSNFAAHYKRWTIDTINNASLVKRRVTFIDLLRAYAILMMLQGHFTDTLLDVSYRDLSHPVFATWSFMRGMTAPIFFFASGLIFIFLLLKNNLSFWENPRVQKGAKRGFQLLFIGYILRISLPRLLQGDIYPGLFAVDVLHCIGIALWVLIICYYLSEKLKTPLPVFLISGALAIFLLHFTLKETPLEAIPAALSNYFNKENGSVFTPVPWVGYALLGGALGYALNKRPQLAFGQWLPAGLLATGLLTHFYSYHWLIALHEWTGIEAFYRHANYNFLLWRLGHVFVAVALFIWIAQLWKNIPALLLKIGGETLVIYEVHYVLLYSTWFGIGLSSFWYRSLTPLQTTIGALAFVLFFVLMIAHIDRIRSRGWAWWKPKVAYAWRFSRVMLKKRYYRWRLTTTA